MGAVAHINDYKKGHYFSNEGRGGMSWNGYENNVLLKNLGIDKNGVPQFADVAMALGADDIIDSRGIGIFDFDHDGDLDVAVSHNPGDLYKEEGIPPALYRNDVGQGKEWLAVELIGTKVNRDAIGAEVYVQADHHNLMRLRSAGSSYASQHGHRLYFGLGESTVVATLKVRWPGGHEEVFKDIQTRQLVRITEGQGIELTTLPTLKTNTLAHNPNANDAAQTGGR